MISKCKWLISQETVPYRNIAAERLLTLQAEEGECILFLWQNRRTVVVGRNQNAWEECQIEELRKDGGYLARRFSGGGAVYHDLGNLNFSFLTRKGDDDPERQSRVILQAVRKLGVPARKTGRNDLEAEGRKFSGNASYETRGCCCRHGTLMMDVSTADMEKYLNVEAGKLRSKGVASVRSRVMNLKEACPELTVGMLESRLLEAFAEEYGLQAEPLEQDRPAADEIRKEAHFLASEEWLFPPRIPFTVEMGGRFSWGGIRIRLAVRQNRIDGVECWSDAMEEDLILRIRESLRGCRYDPDTLAGLVTGADRTEGADQAGNALNQAERLARARIAEDIAGMIRERMTGELPGI